MEETNELGFDINEMAMRQYDPAIARWTVIDPVTHHNFSPYQAFDNNPVYFADPSGADSEINTGALLQNMFNASDSGTKWYNSGNGSFSTSEGSDPQEGASRAVKVPHTNGLDGMDSYSYEKQFYHSGGVGDFGSSKAGWYSESEYFELYRTTIRSIGQGQASIESLNNYNFTDDVLLAMSGWAMSALDTYGGSVPATGHGTITPLYFTDFMPGKITYKGLKKLFNMRKMSFWSGRGSERAATWAGFTVLRNTNAGKNMMSLTANMSRAQSGPYWDRLSAALAKTYKRGSTANVYLSRSYMKTKSFQNSTWMRIEKPILENNGVIIKYNYVD